MRIVSFLGHELGNSPCRANDLTALPGFKLNIVYQCTYRYINQWQCITHLDIRIWSRHDLVSDLQTVGGQDITFFTITITQKGNLSVPIGIVLNCLYPSFNSSFGPLEIN